MRSLSEMSPLIIHIAGSGGRVQGTASVQPLATAAISV
jgi:hypothetical protein